MTQRHVGAAIAFLVLLAAAGGCTSEANTDDDHGGAGPGAGSPSGGGGAGAGPSSCDPEIVVAGIVEPSLVAVNDAAVYWADQQALRSQPHGSSVPVTLLQAASAPVDLAVDESSLYWTDSAGLHRLVLATSAEQLLVPGSAGTVCPAALTLDASTVYFDDLCAQVVGKVAKDGTAPATLATNVANADNLAVDASALYVTAEAQGEVLRIALGDGTVSTFAANQNGPQSVTLDADHAYWSSGVQLMQAPKTGGIPSMLATETVQGLYLHIASIAADETGVYWLYADAVRKQTPAGGNTVTLATGQAHPQNMVLHSTGIYWANNNGGSIMMCPR
jgi:hypothetical protein